MTAIEKKIEILKTSKEMVALVNHFGISWEDAALVFEIIVQQSR
jgi:hypothetical protein